MPGGAGFLHISQPSTVSLPVAYQSTEAPALRRTSPAFSSGGPLPAGEAPAAPARPPPWSRSGAEIPGKPDVDFERATAGNDSEQGGSCFGMEN